MKLGLKSFFLSLLQNSMCLKVPKCEIFDLFDFDDIYVMKCLHVGDLGAEIKHQICIIMSLLAYAQCLLETIFDFL